MFEVVSVSADEMSFEKGVATTTRKAVSVRRGGLVHGTRVLTYGGWVPVEALTPGDLVRTADNGFQPLRRVSQDLISVPADETRPDFLPVRVPAGAAYNKRTVWLMPEQGIAVAASWLDAQPSDSAIVAARLLSGSFAFGSAMPATRFPVTTLFFDQDEIICIEGGLRAYFPACRIGGRARTTGQSGYPVLDEESGAALVASVAAARDLSALACPVSGSAVSVPRAPVVPVRPVRGERRAGRPGRPRLPALLLRADWQS